MIRVTCVAIIIGFLAMAGAALGALAFVLVELVLMGESL
jgi:hypothetical protein